MQTSFRCSIIELTRNICMRIQPVEELSPTAVRKLFKDGHNFQVYHRLSKFWCSWLPEYVVEARKITALGG
jgi:hypothetical protein